MKTLPPILNREFKLPDDGKVHLVPRGNYPVVHEGKSLVQVVDDAALAAMAANLQTETGQPAFGGLCIDFDHNRHDEDKASRAGGWLDTGVENRATGLFGAPRWSASGRAAVEGGDYRFISPEFDPYTLEALGGNKFRPTRLVGFGLTNNPNMRGMAPLSNRRVGASHGPTHPADDSKHTPNMKSVTSLLGLADGADEPQIAAAVTTLKTDAGKVPVLTNRVRELEAEQTVLVGEQIDADLAATGIKDEDTIAQLKPVLAPMKNRAERVKFLGLFKSNAAQPAKGKVPLTNRVTAKNPDADPGVETGDATPESTKRDHAIVNRARRIMADDKKVPQSTAYQMARSQVESEEAAAKD